MNSYWKCACGFFKGHMCLVEKLGGSAKLAKGKSIVFTDLEVYYKSIN